MTTAAPRHAGPVSPRGGEDTPDAGATTPPGTADAAAAGDPSASEERPATGVDAGVAVRRHLAHRVARRQEPVPSPDDIVEEGRTIRLSAPPGFRLLDLGAIADDVVVTAAPDRHITSVYLDTPDLRLVRWGAALRHRDGEGWTVRLPPTGSQARGPERHLPGALGEPPEEAVALLSGYVRTARLGVVARLRTVRRSLLLSTHEGRPLAEIDDDEVSVLDGRRVAARFREVDVDVAEGSPTALLVGILERLSAAGAGVVDPTPKLVHALGARALDPPEVEVPDVGPRDPAGLLVQRAVAASVLRLLEHDGGLRSGQEPEDVHQARVATRRLRSDLRTFAPLVEAAWADPLRAELSWLADDLGAVRDAEVLQMRLRAHAAELPGIHAGAASRLASRLSARTRRARADLAVTIRSERYLELLDRLVEAARAPVLTLSASRPAASTCAELVAAPWRSLRRAESRLGEHPADEQLHDLRIRAKRLRYAAEASTRVLGRRATAVGRAAAGLQEVLGDLNDAVVAAEWLREHAAEGRDAFAAGMLCAGEHARAEAGREAWPDAWRRLRRRAAAWS